MSPPYLAQAGASVTPSVVPLREPSTWIALAVAAVLAFIASGCGAAYTIDPDRTTYPRHAIRQQQVKMAISPQDLGTGVGIQAGGFKHLSVTKGRPFLEFERTVAGDSATHEILIVPNKRGAWTEASLLAGVPEAARRVCGHAYRINSTKYYNGTEGTSKFMGIEHPWLNVEVRCPLKLETEDTAINKLLTEVSKTVPEAEYFDIHEKDYPLGVTQLRVAIGKVLAGRGMLITKTFGASEMDVLVTDRHRSGMIGFPVYQQLIAVLAKRNNGSVLVTRLLAYNQDFRGRSDAIGSIRLIPVPRNFAYRYVQALLGEIAKAVESQ